MLRNPLLPADCPDPCVVPVDGGFLLVATTFFDDIEDKFPLHRSADLEAWTPLGHVFPAGSTPAWAVSQFWAPELHRVEDRWLCYFTARDTTGRLCLGVASAERPEGPFRDLGAPLLRDDRVGLIDAHRFVDADGRAYLFYKVDGNDLAPREPTPIRVRALTPDGLGFVGAAVDVLVNDQPWEAHVIEGPWAVRRGEHVYLFYSGNAFHTPEYATGVARARSVLGPYEKLAAPLLASGSRWRGPGHGCVVETQREDLFVHHAWDGDAVFERHPRLALVARVRYRGGWPELTLVEDR